MIVPKTPLRHNHDDVYPFPQVYRHYICKNNFFVYYRRVCCLCCSCDSLVLPAKDAHSLLLLLRGHWLLWCNWHWSLLDDCCRRRGRKGISVHHRCAKAGRDLWVGSIALDGCAWRDGVSVLNGSWARSAWWWTSHLKIFGGGSAVAGRIDSWVICQVC